MNKKYERFIQLLNFNKNKYSAEKVFRDFISIYALGLSNVVALNENNKKKCEEIYKEYSKEEQFYFYTLATELTRIFCNETDPYDILGDIYQEITQKNYLKLIKNSNDSKLCEVGRKLQGIMNINKKNNRGKMVEVNCGSGAMILAYASTLKIFKLDYKKDLEVTAIDTDIINVFMTYIQLYFFKISAIVILADNNNNEIMRLYTPAYDYAMENLIAA